MTCGSWPDYLAERRWGSCRSAPAWGRPAPSSATNTIAKCKWYLSHYLSCQESAQCRTYWSQNIQFPSLEFRFPCLVRVSCELWAGLVSIGFCMGWLILTLSSGTDEKQDLYWLFLYPGQRGIDHGEGGNGLFVTKVLYIWAFLLHHDTVENISLYWSYLPKYMIFFFVYCLFRASFNQGRQFPSLK